MATTRWRNALKALVDAYGGQRVGQGGAYSTDEEACVIEARALLAEPVLDTDPEFVDAVTCEVIASKLADLYVPHNEGLARARALLEGRDHRALEMRHTVQCVLDALNKLGPPPGGVLIRVSSWHEN